MKTNHRAIQKVLVSISCALAGLVAGCGYEEGYEYTVVSDISPLNSSIVNGRIIVGHGRLDPRVRVRVKLHWLTWGRRYRMRFFDAATCRTTNPVDARTTSAKVGRPFEERIEAGISLDQLEFSANIFGADEQEFRLNDSGGGASRFENPGYIVMIVPIRGGDKGSDVAMEPVACGIVTERPTYRTPHM